MIFDTHIHSEFSFDSNFKISEIIYLLSSNDIGLVLTEHVDLDYDLDDNSPVDFVKYFDTFSNYTKNNLLLGVEIGLPVNYLNDTEALVNAHNFDFVIGSVHSISNIDICMDYSKKDLSKTKLYTNYFSQMVESVNAYNNFDSLGHVDYICRYVNFNNKEIDLSLSKDYLTQIFSTILSKGKVLELNTRRLNSYTAYNSLKEIYNIYKSLGGKYITIGSDAHNKNDVLKNFDLAFNLCDELNLKPIYFKNREICDYLR